MSVGSCSCEWAAQHKERGCVQAAAALLAACPPKQRTVLHILTLRVHCKRCMLSEGNGEEPSRSGSMDVLELAPTILQAVFAAELQNSLAGGVKKRRADFREGPAFQQRGSGSRAAASSPAPPQLKFFKNKCLCSQTHAMCSSEAVMHASLEMTFLAQHKHLTFIRCNSINMQNQCRTSAWHRAT